MAKRFVKIKLAAKCRLLFGVATIAIIAAALVVPWIYMETMAKQRVLRAGDEITRLYFHEWSDKHHQNTPADTVSDLFVRSDSPVGDQDAAPLVNNRRGPHFLLVGDDHKLPDIAARRAVRTFRRNPKATIVQAPTADRGAKVYKVYRAVRAQTSCMTANCHGDPDNPMRQWRRNQLVGMVAADLPALSSAGELLIRRLVIVAAGVLALMMGSAAFYFITQKLILSPVQELTGVADKAAEGDLTVRSEIDTGDEFERLGHSFDEMLEAVTKTQTQLRTANRALDLKLNDLAESNVALYEANRLKSEFLANVSHELRTPLNSIIGFAELLSEMDEDRTKRYSKNILTPARMLLRIINDLLDLARIEAGRVKVTLTQASVADICETLVSLVTPQAQKKNLDLSLSVADGVPVIETDAGKLQQILYNLLDNAIKFTPAGGSVTLAAVYDAEDDAALIHIIDTGPGISEADRTHIFEKFYQADGSTTRSHGGAGLGLAIARDLAELLGGELSLTSETGEGATFTLRLPMEMPRPAAGETAGV